MTKRLDVVIPCFNEVEVLRETRARIGAVLDGLVAQGKISPGSGIYFVDDGSRDRTWPLIEELARDDARCHGIKLSRNRGHQMALLAGLHTVTGDIVVSVDADLQDDPGAIERMVDEHLAGADVVYGVRADRSSDGFVKRFTAEGYYRLLKLFGVDIVFNHADYRLLSRRALDALKQFGEVNMFLRGVVPQLGFRTSVVEYVRAERFAGESKYPLRKMLSLAVEGITSFSPLPLRWITLVGFLVSLATFGIGLWALVASLLDATVPGWASTVIPIYFLGGVQLMSLGVIGEYVAKIYTEVKRRPRYFIEEQL